MSRVKVVILNWNGRAHLERYLPSVVRATMPKYGVVVADNGSTDSSLEYVAETFPEVEIVRLDRNYGFAEGYNRALQEIEAEYYVLLNSDVEVTEGWCDWLVEALDADPQLAAVAPKLLADTDRERFEYAGASGGFIDILGYPFCRGRILSTTERDEGQYDTPREVFGQVERRLPVVPSDSRLREVSMAISLPIWRRSTFAGECSRRATEWVSSLVRRSIIWAVVRSARSRRARQCSTTATIWQCSIRTCRSHICFGCCPRDWSWTDWLRRAVWLRGSGKA